VIRTRRITIEIELEAHRNVVNTAHDAYDLQKHVRDYVFHDGKSDEWRLADHLIEMNVRAENGYRRSDPSVPEKF
jgi:hypothetical protein